MAAPISFKKGYAGLNIKEAFSSPPLKTETTRQRASDKIDSFSQEQNPPEWIQNRVFGSHHQRFGIFGAERKSHLGDVQKIAAKDWWKMVHQIVYLLRSVDILLEGVEVTEGKGGFRCPEMARTIELKKALESCNVETFPGNRAIVRTGGRPIDGTDKTAIYFDLEWAKPFIRQTFPDRLVQIFGFRFVPQLDLSLPLSATVKNPSPEGYELQFITRFNPTSLPIPVFGLPIGLLIPFFTETFAPERITFTKDYNGSWGLSAEDIEKRQPGFHQKYKTTPGKVASTSDGFTHQIEGADPSPPGWEDPNKIRGLPKLFNIKTLSAVSIQALLRKGSIEIPKLGKIDLEPIISSNNSPDLSVVTSAQETLIRLKNTRIKHAKLNEQPYLLHIENAESEIEIHLPPIQELIQKINQNTFRLNSDLKIEFKNLRAEKLDLFDASNQTHFLLEGARIEKLDLHSFQDLKLRQIHADLIWAENKEQNWNFSAHKAFVPFLGLYQKPPQKGFELTRIDAEKIKLVYEKTVFEAAKSTLKSFHFVDHPDESGFQIGHLSSSGYIDYFSKEQGLKFTSKGNSKLNSVSLMRIKDADQKTIFEINFNLQGKVDTLKIDRSDFSTKLSNVEFEQSNVYFKTKIETELDTKLLDNSSYAIDLRLKEGTIEPSNFSILKIKDSKIKSGGIQIQKDTGGVPHFHAWGELDLNIDVLKMNRDSFKIPETEINGTLEELKIKGTALLRLDEQGLVLQNKRPTFEKQSKLQNEALKLEGKLKDFKVLFETSDHSKQTQKFKTEQNTNLQIGNLEKIELQFTNPSKPTLKTLEARNIKINLLSGNLEAALRLPFPFGEIDWAKISLGTFRLQNGDLKSSFLEIDALKIGEENQKPFYQIEGFETALYEKPRFEKSRMDQTRLSENFIQLSLPFLHATADPWDIDTQSKPISVALSIKNLKTGQSLKWGTEKDQNAQLKNRFYPKIVGEQR